MQPFDTWETDSEYSTLDVETKREIALEFFRQNLADDEFNQLPEGERREIHSEFLRQAGYGGLPEPQPELKVFDPEGPGYDYDTAKQVGKPDDRGHWFSLDPRTGMVLKGRQHDTWNLMEEEERRRGNKIILGDDNRYYAVPDETKLPLPGSMPSPEFMAGDQLRDRERTPLLGSAMDIAKRTMSDIMKTEPSTAEIEGLLPGGMPSMQQEPEKLPEPDKQKAPGPSPKFRGVTGEWEETGWLRSNWDEGLKDVKRAALESVRMLTESLSSYSKRALEATPEKYRETVEKNYQAPTAITPKVLDQISAEIAEKVEKPNLKALPINEQVSGIGKWVGDFARFAPQMIFQMGASLVGGPPLSMSFMFSQIAGSHYESLRKNSDIDPERAMIASMLDATAQTPMEQFGINRMMKFWKPSRRAAHWMKELFIRGFTEWGTEWLQKYPELVTDIWAKTEGKSNKERLDMFMEQFGQATFEGMYEGTLALPFAFFGLAGSANKAYYKAEAERIDKLIREVFNPKELYPGELTDLPPEVEGEQPGEQPTGEQSPPETPAAPETPTPPEAPVSPKTGPKDHPSYNPEAETWADELKLNYDGVAVMNGTILHQFTPEPKKGYTGAAKKATFSVPEDQMTPEGIRAALAEKEKQFGAPPEEGEAPTTPETPPTPEAPTPPSFIQDAVNRYNQEGEGGITWVLFQQMTADDFQAFDKYLVDIKHPLAEQPGTYESRFRAYVKELAGQEKPTAPETPKLPAGDIESQIQAYADTFKEKAASGDNAAVADYKNITKFLDIYRKGTKEPKHNAFMMDVLRQHPTLAKLFPGRIPRTAEEIAALKPHEVTKTEFPQHPMSRAIPKGHFLSKIDPKTVKASDLKGLSGKELKALAHMLDVPISGTKPVLISRIAQHYAARRRIEQGGLYNLKKDELKEIYRQLKGTKNPGMSHANKDALVVQIRTTARNAPELAHKRLAEALHYRHVEKALKAGEKVPNVVLKDYPELVEKYGKGKGGEKETPKPPKQPPKAPPAPPKPPAAPKPPAPTTPKFTPLKPGSSTIISLDPARTQEFIKQLKEAGFSDAEIQEYMTGEDIWVDPDGKPPRTSKPVTLTAYRGYGREKKDSVYGEGLSGPVFGEGSKYYAISETRAKKYGPKTEKRKIQLQNPLVLSNNDDLSDALGAPIPTSNAERTKLFPQLTRWIKEKGYDGVIINIPVNADIDASGKSVKRLREVFGESQVVVFEDPEVGSPDAKPAKPKTGSAKINGTSTPISAVSLILSGKNEGKVRAKTPDGATHIIAQSDIETYPDIVGLRLQKKLLLDQIKAAIKNPPKDPDATVTFTVPGDGEFMIPGSKKSLTAFRVLVSKSWPENARRPNPFAKATTRPANKRQSGHGVRYYNEFNPRREKLVDPDLDDLGPMLSPNGYWANGAYLVKLPKGEKAKGVNRDPEDTSRIHAPDNLISELDKKYMVKAVLLGEFSDTTEDGESTTPPLVHAVTQDGKAEGIYDAAYIDSVLSYHPTAEAYFHPIAEGFSQIVFIVDGDVVGVVAPHMATLQSDYVISRMKKIKRAAGIPIDPEGDVDPDSTLEPDDAPELMNLGINAAAADREALKKAVLMDVMGKAWDDIRQETGWFRGYDNKWRFEISEHDVWWKKNWEQLTKGKALAKTSEVGNQYGEHRLGDILDHPTLFDNYPELADVIVEKKPFLFSAFTDGSYNPSTKRIRLRPELSPIEALQTLVHEIQHWVQYREGFASGGNERTNNLVEVVPKLRAYWQRQYDEAKEAYDNAEKGPSGLKPVHLTTERVLAKGRLDKVKEFEGRLGEIKKIGAALQSELDKAKKLRDKTEKEASVLNAKIRALFVKWENADAMYMAKLKGKPDEERRKIRAEWRKFREDIRVELAQLQKSRDALYEEERRARKKVTEFEIKQRDFEQPYTELKYQAYRLLAGEIEARDVSDRIALTPEDRQMTLPFKAQGVNPDEAVVLFDAPEKTSPESAEAPEAAMDAPEAVAGEKYVGRVGDTVATDISPPKKMLRREDILIPLLKKLGIYIFEGRVRLKNVAGYHKPWSGTLRIKRRSDIEIAAHEIAHWLDKRIWGYERRQPWLSGPRRTLFATELKTISYDKKMVSEGFAEFVRHWMTRPQIVETATPEFLAYWESEVLPKINPKWRKAILAARKGMRQWFAQDLLTRMQAKTGTQRSLSEALDSLWNKFRQRVVDDFHYIWTAERYVTGERDAVELGPYMTARMTRGAYAVVEGAIKYGVPIRNADGSYRFEGRSLRAVLRPILDRADQWKAYAVARSAAELATQRREKLFSEGEIEEGFLLGNKPENSDFARVFDNWLEWNKGLLDFAVDHGLLSRSQVESFQRTQYLPFYRVGQRTISRRVGGVEGNIRITRRLTGGDANIGDPLENMIMNAQHLIVESIKNQARTKLMRFLTISGLEQGRPSRIGGGKFAEYIGPDVKPVFIDQDQVIKKVYESLGVTKQMLNAGLVDPETADFLERVKSGMMENEEHLKFWLFNQAPTRPNTIAIMVEGKAKYYEVEPHLYQSIEALNPKYKSAPLRFLSTVRRLVQGTVTLTFDFATANIVRDTFQASILSGNGFKPGWSSARGLVHILRRDQVYKDWLANGGGLSGFYNDPGAFEKRLKRFYTSKGINWKNVFINPANWLYGMETLAGAFENATRVGEFERALLTKDADGNPTHPVVAAYRSSEISTDFTMRGDSQYLGWLYDTVIFLKAGVVSLDRFYRGFTKDYNRKVIYAKAGMLGVASAILYTLNRGRPEYEDLEDWDKIAHWHFIFDNPITGKSHHFRLMKIWEIGTMASLAEFMAEKVWDLHQGKDIDPKESASYLGRLMMNTVNLDPMVLATGPMTTLVKPLVEVYGLNKNLFSGRTIVPEHMKDRAAWLQYNQYTNRSLVRLAELSRDVFSFSPARAEALIRGYFNTMGFYGLFIADELIYDYQRGEKPTTPISKYPVIRRFYVEQPRKTKYHEQFYNYYNAVRELHNTVVNLEKQNRPRDAYNYRRKDIYRYRDVINNYYSEIRQHRRAIEEIYNNRYMSADTKRQRIDWHNTQINRLMERGVRAVKR